MVMFVTTVDYSVFAEIILALLLGALVGIEREYHRKIEKRINYLGVRTSMLMSLLGFVFGNIYTSTIGNVSVLLAAFAVITVMASMVYSAKVKLHGTAGATTYTAMFLVFMGGVLIGMGSALLSAIIIIITTGVLAIKQEFTEFVTVLDKHEILSAIKLAVISFIVLPFLPNQAIDPWKVFNPFSFWLIVVVLSAISFLSFILSKIHKSGIFLSSLTGGFVSSSAVTYSIAKMVEKREVDSGTALSGILISNVGMILSQVIIISLIVYGNTSALRYSVVPAAIPAAFFLAFSLVINRKAGKKISLESPFSLKAALSFAMIFLFISVISLLFKDTVGVSSLYVLAFISGIANVGATVASMGLLAAGNIINLQAFGLLSVIAMIAGILVKLVWVSNLKNRELFNKMLLYGVSISILSLFAYFLQFALSY